MALPALAGAAIGAGSSLLPSLPDYAGMGMSYLGTGMLTGNWGGTSKERKNQIHDIRTLRRREYQDMVHSLTEAGLNPILAVGASPGHATAQQVGALTNYQTPDRGTPAGAGSAFAANRQAGVAETKAPAEIAGLQAGIPRIVADTKLAEANAGAQQESITTQRALQEVYKQDAINKGASAKKINEEIEQIRKFGLPGQSMWGYGRQLLTDPALGNSAKGLLRELDKRLELTPKPISERLNDRGIPIPRR